MRRYSRSEKALVIFGIALPSLVLGSTIAYQKLNEIPDAPIPSPTLPNPNAHETLTQASRLSVEKQGEIMVSPVPVRNPQTNKNEVPPQPLAGRQALRDANKEAIAMVRTALTQEYVQPPARSFSATFPEFAQYRNLARILAFSAQVAREEGNTAEAMRCQLDAMEMGVQIPNHGVLIGALVGIASEAIGRKGAWGLADTLDATTAREAIRRIERFEARRFPFAETLQEEKWSTRAGLIEVFRKGPGEFMKAVMPSSSDNPPPSFQNAWGSAVIFLTPKKLVLDNNAKYMDALSARARLPYSPSKPLPPEPTDLINKILLPVFSQADFKDTSNRADTALLKTYLAIRAYKLEKGTLPESLDVLVKDGYLATLPIDPFSPQQQPFHYRPDGTLYSVGPDADDDNGRAIISKDQEKYKDKKRGFVDMGDEGDLVARINTY